MNTISGERLAEIANQFGTPCWVYDAACIRRRIAQLKIFDVVRYAQKANSNLHLLHLLKSLGVLVDAVSLGEIERAHVAGFNGNGDPSGIVFTSDVLDRNTLRRVIELDIPVNVGSPQMLEQLGRAHPGHRVWIRINPGFGHGHSKKTNTGGENSKHGIWYEHIEECYHLVDQYQLDLVGLHMHIGSGVDYEHLRLVCDTMVAQVKRCKHDIRAISAGGGLPIPYRAGDIEVDIAQYYDVWNQARKEVEQHVGHAVSLEIEPGRIVVAESGSLISEVRAKKDMGANHFVLVDAGFNDLMRPAMYGSHHQISLLQANGQPQLATKRPTVVAGPLCESGDVFTQQAGGEVTTQMLPEANIGDLAVFHDCGAYGASMSSNYNSRPLLPEILVDGEIIKLIRRRQTMDELLALETVNIAE
ncbi:MAG: diaminopimelate decarboxylase [Pseudomonadota bacterium]